MALIPTSPSNSLPQPLSYQQIVAQLNSSYAAAIGVNDLNVGSANVSFTQIVGLMVARASGDIFQILNDYSLQRAQGPALQNLAIEYGVPPLPAQTATGFVTVTDLSFQKISTVIYAGQNPPILGSTTIYVSDASKFPATGSVYLGRSTVNVEGPIAYSSITPVGTYYQINLSAPTTRFHNIGETVILSQGGVRTVPINTIVISPGIGTTPTVQYSVTQTSTILDGETTVTNVPITAQIPGALANVPAGSISQFSGNPAGLSNASVNNPLAITTGADLETDNQLRTRVQNALASTGLGTVTAIESALIGVQAPNSGDTIASVDILNNSSNTIVYIDNSGILEATHTGVPIEAIVNSALGGEKFFQLVTGGTQTSVTKALLQTVAAEPFNLSGGEVLAVVVGNTTYDHTFQASDFANPGSATAYEVAASINGDTTLNYEAVTAGNGTYVVIRPEDEITNVIQVTTPASTQVIDANTILQFPAQLATTLLLYQNGKLLTEDGSTASVFSQSQSLWSSTLASGETLIIAVDGTAPITYTLTDADFVAEGTYTTLSYSNSLQSWANVLNEVVTGITASVVGSTLEITSNLGAIDRAQVTISRTSTLVTKGVFNSAALSSTGIASQYILNRNTAQIQLVTALNKGDSLSAGYAITQANIEGSEVPAGSVTLTSNAYAWIAIDTDATIIPTIMSGPLLSVSVVGDVVTYTANSLAAFSNVLVGDYVIVWSPQIPTTDQLEGRVHAFTGSTLSIKVTAAEAAAVIPVTNAAYVQGFVVVRTPNVPQKFEVTTGTKTLNVVATELQTQTDELTFGVSQNVSITVETNTLDPTGQITVVTANAEGQVLGFVAGTNSVSQTALTGFSETLSTQSELPLFFHSPISADSYAEPPDSFLTSFTSTNSVAAFDPNELIDFLNPYGGIDDEQPNNETVQMSAISGGDVITILPDYPDVRRLRINDRFFVANPLDFGYNDTVVAIVDNNTLSETYTMPLYRRAITNGTYSVNNYSFNANDVDDGVNSNFATNENFYPPYAPADFFANYKALMQAKAVISETNANTSLLYRSAIWGRSGEAINIAYVYPTSPNQPISSLVTVNDSTNVNIILPSGNALSTTISATTQWNVTVTSNTPTAGIDQVTYTYAANQYVFTVTSATANAGDTYTNNGNTFTVLTSIVGGTTLVTSGTGAPTSSGNLVRATGSGTNPIVFSSVIVPGTAPNLPVGLSAGAYVTILPSTGFNVKDTGTFSISTAAGYTPTSTSFSVQVPTGTAVAQTGAVTGVPSGISFYSSSPTTASAISTYVNANLNKYVTTTVVNGDGSGDIVLSTYEDSGFTVHSYYLFDGINWIFSSNLTGSPQFTFKSPLTYPSAPGYAFNNGEEVRLIPTTMDQVKDLWNVLAVTGFTTVGTIETVDRGTKLQLATNTIGSGGSIQVVGGSGNQYTVPVLTSGELIDPTHMIISANSIASQAVASDQWFRLQAENYQNKNTGFAQNTDVTVASNTPIAGESTVTLSNQNINQLYFGAPKSFVTVSGSTFRIERQGLLACLSWTGAGTTPVFTTAANLTESAGWTASVTSTGLYTVTSGTTNFSALSIGDLVTISGFVNPTNNGTFFVEGVSATSIQVSNASAVAENSPPLTTSSFSATLSVSEGDTVIISGPFAPLNQGTYRVIRMNNNSIWYENPDVVEEEQTPSSNSQIQFFQYDATVPGDKLVVDGTVLGAGNAGTYKVLQVTSPTVIVVSGTITSQVDTNLGGNYTSLAIQEGTKYTGYKQVSSVAFDPGSSDYNDIVFNTVAQYDKINLSAGVGLTSLGKLNFPVVIVNGIDAYNYDTGLIGQANRVVYGDPRDAVTYPGVNAAGTNIYIREPLLKSVSVSLAIRTNIGVSFAQITNQIQSSVYSLISSNPLGQSIDLSSIVETVRAIPGVTSVVLISPTYSVASDEIVLVTGQKAFVPSQVNNISVALIGT